MKTTTLLSALSLMFILISSSCKKEDNSNSAPSVSSIVTQGNWRVTLYSENGVNETSKFSNYSFTFNSNGTVSAVSSGSTVSGTWSNANDDSQHKLILNFSNPSTFVEISDDWHIVEQTSVKIRLEDVSGGNGGTDLLTFEKN